MSKDDIGDRMKYYESLVTDKTLDKAFPIYVRLDGRSFSSLTKSMQKPFDQAMSMTMVEVTKHLVKSTNACIGYTQSDEISLVYNYPNPESEILFGGKIHKLTSVLAGQASSAFMYYLTQMYTDDFAEYLMRKMPHFDARVIQMPNKTETANMILWRYLDCKKNAVSMAAHSMFPHSTLQNKNTNDMIEMMRENNKPFDSVPDRFKYGTFVFKSNIQKYLTHDELMEIPEHVRPDPETPVTRTVMKEWACDVFLQWDIKAKISLIFNND